MSIRSERLTWATLNERIAAADALIFDCDGTLVESGPVYAQAWSRGFDVSHAAMNEAWYRARNGLSEQVLMDQFEAEMAVRLDRERVVDVMRAAYQANLAALYEVHAVAAIARRWRNQKPMAVASGGPAALVVPSLRVLGLDQLFQAIVTIEDVARPKPAPDLFLAAANELRVAPSRCLVFEDSAQGVAAAMAAQCTVVDVAEIIALG